MSVCYATIAIEDFAAGPLGGKEALAMAVEHLGGVRVLEVRVLEPEQIKLGPPPKPSC